MNVYVNVINENYDQDHQETMIYIFDMNLQLLQAQENGEINYNHEDHIDQDQQETDNLNECHLQENDINNYNPEDHFIQNPQERDNIRLGDNNDEYDQGPNINVYGENFDQFFQIQEDDRIDGNIEDEDGFDNNDNQEDYDIFNENVDFIDHSQEQEEFEVDSNSLSKTYFYNSRYK